MKHPNINNLLNLERLNHLRPVEPIKNQNAKGADITGLTPVHFKDEANTVVFCKRKDVKKVLEKFKGRGK